jgi:hypothetical protein
MRGARPKFPYHGCLQPKCRLVISISQCNAIFCGFRLQIPIRAKFSPTQRTNCQTEFPAVGSTLRNMSTTPSAKTSGSLVKMCKAQFAHPGYAFGTQLWSSLLAVWLVPRNIDPNGRETASLRSVDFYPITDASDSQRTI